MGFQKAKEDLRKLRVLEEVTDFLRKIRTSLEAEKSQEAKVFLKVELRKLRKA